MAQPDAQATLHEALCYLASACIDESLPDEAEAIYAFLEPMQMAPRTLGLVQVWLLSERGSFVEALHRCEELVGLLPNCQEFQPMLALLRYVNDDPDWRSTCDQLVDSPTAEAGSKRLALSLLDGSFFDKKDVDEEPADASPPEANHWLGVYMRA